MTDDLDDPSGIPQYLQVAKIVEAVIRAGIRDHEAIGVRCGDVHQVDGVL